MVAEKDNPSAQKQSRTRLFYCRVRLFHYRVRMFYCRVRLLILPCTAVNIAVYVKKMNPYTALQMMGVDSGRVIGHAYWASIKHGGC